VAQAFQPAIQLPEESAGWKARPTLKIQDRTFKSQALGTTGGAQNHCAGVPQILSTTGVPVREMACLSAGVGTDRKSVVGACGHFLICG